MLTPLAARRQLTPLATGIQASPIPTADLRLWLAGRFITGLSDGNNIATWADESGNGFDATQTDNAERPQYQTGEINSLPAVEFVRPPFTEGMNIPAIMASASAAYTLYAVVRPDNVTGTEVGFLSLSTENNFAPGVSDNVRFLAADSPKIDTTSVQIAFTGVALSNGNWYILTFQLGAGAAVGTTKCWVGETALSESSGDTSTLNIPATGGYVGRWSNIRFDGMIAEILFYNAEHDASTRAVVWDYLQTIYNL